MSEGKKPFRFMGVRPCAHCPFRNDIRPYLLPNRVLEISNVLVNDGTFHCHETTVSVEHEDGSEERIVVPESLHCAGAAIILEKLEMPNQMMRIMERIGAYDRRTMDMDAPVYDSFDDLYEATVKEHERIPGRGRHRRRSHSDADQ